MRSVEDVKRDGARPEYLTVEVLLDIREILLDVRKLLKKRKPKVKKEG